MYWFVVVFFAHEVTAPLPVATALATNSMTKRNQLRPEMISKGMRRIGRHREPCVVRKELSVRTHVGSLILRRGRFPVWRVRH